MLSDLHDLSLQLGGDILHTVRDRYGRIVVVDDGRQRILSFDSLFEQSCMQRSQPYQLVHQYTQFMALAVTLVDPVHVTFFGLGGGSLLRTLHHVVSDCQFHAVELRQAVVGVARDYFQLPDDKRVKITVGDASEEIKHLDGDSSDIIFSDMYDAYQMAPVQTTQIFLQECHRVLRDNGWLVINFIHLPREQDAFLNILCAIFPTVLVCACSENTVVFASAARHASVEADPDRLETLERMLRQRYSHLPARLEPVAAPGEYANAI